MKTIKRYKFKFYFYNEYALIYESFFINKRRLPIWNSETPNNTMTGEFVEYYKDNNDIIGYLDVLIDENKDLQSNVNKKYLLNHPDNLVGHIILLKD